MPNSKLFQRDVELDYSNLSACKFETGKLQVSDNDNDNDDDDGKGWTEVKRNGDGESCLDCTFSAPPGASIRIPPMSQRNKNSSSSSSNRGTSTRPQWRTDSHFHPLLQFPATATATSSDKQQQQCVCVLLESNAREGVAIALSPDTRFCIGETYEVYFGDVGNTRTTVMLRQKQQQQQTPTPKQPKSKRGGDTTIKNKDGEENGVDEDESKEEEKGDDGNQSNEEEEDIEGDENENEKDETKKEDCKTAAAAVPPPKLRSTLEISWPSRVCQERAWKSFWVCLANGRLFAGVGAVPGQHCVVLLDVDDVPEEKTTNNGTASAAENTTMNKENDDDDDEDNENSNKKDNNNDDPQPPRPIRYVGLGNTSIDDRQTAASLQVRNVRLVSHLPGTLLTHLKSLTLDGLDLVLEDDQIDQETRTFLKDYQKECQKARARAVKFGTSFQQPPPPDIFLPWSEARRLRANPSAGFVTGFDLSDPAERAKIEARRKRFGAVAAAATAATSDNASQGAGGDNEAQQQQADDGSTENNSNNAGENNNNKHVPPSQAWDKERMTRKLRVDPPSPLWNIPPEEDFEEMPDASVSLVPGKIHIFGMDWAAFKQLRTQDIMAYFKIYGPSYVEWLGDLSANVLFQDKFTAARALENLSSVIPSPPPDEVVKEYQQTDSDDIKEAATATTTTTTPPDFGNMGWRIGKRMLRKVSNDRYGRRGTTARILMRVATSLDILSERPSSWLKPPAGFSTKRILGPQSDNFGNRGGRGSKEKRRRSFPEEGGTGNNNNNNSNSDPSEDHPLLGQGLKSGRSGFTVEELEAERAKKRVKATQK